MDTRISNYLQCFKEIEKSDFSDKSKKLWRDEIKRAANKIIEYSNKIAENSNINPIERQHYELKISQNKALIQKIFEAFKEAKKAQ